MEEVIVLESPKVVVSFNKCRKQDGEYSVAVIGPSMTGKSRFIGRFLKDINTAEILYSDNNLGKTKVNTRYILENRIENIHATIVLDIDVIISKFTSENKSYQNQELNDYVEKRYSEICEIIRSSITEEYDIRSTEYNDSMFICKYFDKFSLELSADLDLNEIFEFDLWVEPSDDLNSLLEEKNINVLSLVDTRGVFDNMQICNRKMPTYIDANILFFKPLTSTSELISKIADDLKLFLSNPTELCLRFTAGGSIYPNLISEEAEKQLISLCVEKKMQSNKDVKNLSLYEQIFIEQGILPSKERQKNRLFNELLFNDFGTLIPDIIETNQMIFGTEEEMKLKSSASKRIYNEVTFHVIEKLIEISKRERDAIDKLRSKLKSIETTPLYSAVNKLAAEVAIDKICRGNGERKVFINSAELEPRAAVLRNHMRKQLINNLDKGIIPQISDKKMGCEWLPLQDHVYHYVSVYAYKIIEKIMEENLFGTNEDENFLLTRMFNQMVIKETPSYINYVSSILAKRCSIYSFNNAINKLNEVNKKYTNGNWSYVNLKEAINKVIYNVENRHYCEASWFYCLIDYTTLFEIRNTLAIQVKQFSEEIEDSGLSES